MTREQLDAIRARVDELNATNGHEPAAWEENRLSMADTNALLAEVVRLTAERDGARAEVAFLKRNYSLEAASKLRAELATANAKVERLTAERDEARAEVKRFVKAVHTRGCQQQSAYNETCVCGADEHQRDLRTLAFKRGVAAMREAAAKYFDERAARLHAAGDAITATAYSPNAQIIRALPDPEDKA